MTTIKIIYLYLLTVPVFFAIDMLWLGVFAKNFYQNALRPLLSDSVNWPAAIIFYLIFIAGVIIFAVLPAIEKESLKHALIYGAIFGFIAYATYDLTNYSTLKDWPLSVTLVDMVWGAVLSGSVAGISYWISTLLHY